MPNQVYLINQATFVQYEDLSPNIKPARLLVFVKKMQDLDLKLFLGHALYYDFIQWFSMDTAGNLVINTSIPLPYSQLFNGVAYPDRSGNQIFYEGLIPMLVYFTFARFIEADSVRYTATGPIMKTHDQGTSLSVSDLNKLVQQQRSVANAHANEVEKFIVDNRKNFPLWRYSEQNKSARQAGPRIRGIDKTQYNNPNGLGIRNDNFGINDLLL